MGQNQIGQVIAQPKPARVTDDDCNIPSPSAAMTLSRCHTIGDMEIMENWGKPHWTEPIFV